MYEDGACQRCAYNLLHSVPVGAVTCMSGTPVHQWVSVARAPLPTGLVRIAVKTKLYGARGR